MSHRCGSHTLDIMGHRDINRCEIFEPAPESTAVAFTMQGAVTCEDPATDTALSASEFDIMLRLFNIVAELPPSESAYGASGARTRMQAVPASSKCATPRAVMATSDVMNMPVNILGTVIESRTSTALPSR